MKHVTCYQKGYPRPQFVRDAWTDLNGLWKFGFGEEVTEQDALRGELPRKIWVPYSYETEMSGIGDPAVHRTVWYSRTIAQRAGKRTILHLEGVDHTATVYVNGTVAGTHCGAYSRFSVDITKYLHAGENLLTVRCDDDGHPAQVPG